MAKAKKKKYSASDKAILGIGYVLLGAFVLSILVPLLYVVIASFMDPNVLNSQGISSFRGERSNRPRCAEVDDRCVPQSS